MLIDVGEKCTGGVFRIEAMFAFVVRTFSFRDVEMRAGKV